MFNSIIERIIAEVTDNVTKKLVTPEMTNNFNKDLNVINSKIANMRQEAKDVEAALIDLVKKYPCIDVEDQLKALYEGYEIIKLVCDKNVWIGNSASK